MILYLEDDSFRLWPNLPSSSSVLLAMLDLQSGEKGEVQSASVSQPVHKASCGNPPDWVMSGVSKRRTRGRTAGYGWEFEDLCRMDIRLNGKFSVCGDGRGVESVQFSV